MSTIATISTLQKSLSSRTAIASQDRDVQQARQEMVTGLKADVYADKSFRAAQTLDLRNRLAQAEGYATSNRLLEGKLTIASELMGSMRTSAQEFQALSLSLSSGSQRRDVLQTEAQALLQTLTSQINTVYGGEYLFSGTATSTAGLQMPPGGIAQSVLPPGATPADAALQIAELDSYFGLNGAVPSVPSYLSQAYTGSDAPLVARLDHTMSIEFGMTAADESLRQLLKGLSMYAQTNVDSLSDPAAYKAWVDEANIALNAGITGIQSHEVVLGNQQALLARTIERQEALSGIYNNRVMDIEGVDEFEVATRLESLSAQLEASYAVTVRLKNLSLLNFM